MEHQVRHVLQMIHSPINLTPRAMVSLKMTSGPCVVAFDSCSTSDATPNAIIFANMILALNVARKNPSLDP